MFRRDFFFAVQRFPFLPEAAKISLSLSRQVLLLGGGKKESRYPSSLPTECTDSLKRLFLGCKNLPLRGHGITQPGKTFLRHIVLFPFSPETEPLSPYQMDGFLPHSLFSCSRSQVSCSRTNDPRGRIPREQTLCREIRTTIPPTQTMETPSITTASPPPPSRKVIGLGALTLLNRTLPNQNLLYRNLLNHT